MSGRRVPRQPIRMTAGSFSRPAPGGKLSGYMSAALAAEQATGVGIDLYEKLFDDTDAGVAALRQSIHQQIVDAGKGGRVPVTSDAALAIADQAMRKFLIAAANDQTSGAVLGAASFQKQVAVVAEQLGVPELAAALSDPNSPACQAFKRSLLITQPAVVCPVDFATLQQVAEHRLSRSMARELVEGGHLAKVKCLPRDSDLALRQFADRRPSRTVFFGDPPSPGLEKHQQALARLLHDGIAGLSNGSDEEQKVARQLDRELRVGYGKIADPEVRLGILTRERDEALAEAREPGAGGRSWQQAAMCQNDIIALHLRALGAPLTAQTRSTLEALARRSPELAKAMADLDQIERSFVEAMGGTPGQASLSWRDSRDELAKIRGQLAELRGLAADSEDAPRARRQRAAGVHRRADARAHRHDVRQGVRGARPAAGRAAGELRGAELWDPRHVARPHRTPTSSSPSSSTGPLRLSSNATCRSCRSWSASRSTISARGSVSRRRPAFIRDPAGNSPVEEPDKFIGSARELAMANLREAEEGTPAETFGLTMFSGAEYLVQPAWRCRLAAAQGHPDRRRTLSRCSFRGRAGTDPRAGPGPLDDQGSRRHRQAARERAS